jgi:acyl-coenzyme A synthetase/AMP-(fatty) acid ligase
MQETPLIEIYGCTEVGVIATRRPTISQEWACLDDITLTQSSENLFYIQTNRSINLFTLNDHISDMANNTFILNGRKSDMINIAGKRNSLSYLNHHLLNYKHLSDGCFYQPNHLEESHQRLVVFIVADKDSFSIPDFKHYFRTKADSVFIPRHFYFVDKLPRNKTGKILHNEIKSLYQQLSINN